ncbi:MarR family winged helix-turn-helix transcriptional regulator [Clostridium oceanicum]|uniref:HTH-type transcriptional regulator SarZ n=1 Tax=Clostridium oceanicum TaxID=1543 RepID=A0ABP3V7S5_9CLOT
MQDNINVYMNVISRFCRLQMNLKRDLPIRASEMGVLIYIQKNKEQSTPIMISNFFGIAKPSVTDIINSLVKKNYLIKIKSEIDRRSYILEITTKGYELLENTYEEYFRTIEILQNKMGNKEFKLFIKLLKEANTILSEE